MSVNVSKGIIALAALICITVLMVTNTVAPELGMPIITAIVFYAIGNGIGAKTNTPIEPLIKPKDPQQD